MSDISTRIRTHSYSYHPVGSLGQNIVVFCSFDPSTVAVPCCDMVHVCLPSMRKGTMSSQSPSQPYTTLRTIQLYIYCLHAPENNAFYTILSVAIWLNFEYVRAHVCGFYVSKFQPNRSINDLERRLAVNRSTATLRQPSPHLGWRQNFLTGFNFSE
jgi:hypothetical protein